MDLTSSWADADFNKQWGVARRQLEELRNGNPPAVFESFISLMKNYIGASERLSFLDCACTSGYYLDVIQIALEHRIDFTGSDLAESAIKLARARHPSVDWRVASVTSLPFDSRSFDVVMASGLLEHVPEWRTALNEITRVAIRYVILHRLPISPTGKFCDGKTEMYGIPTSRYSFAYHEIIDILASKGFLIINGIDSYFTRDIPEQTILFKHRAFI
jgi:ubiquinone/menaquinone biosynthesis C-methylase UbiE